MNDRLEKRNLLSSFFITILIGIAFHEMINTIKSPIISDGVTINNSCLGLTFFFVSIRFFIGNQLHLSSDSFLKLPGLLWFYDLIVIIVQSTILVFLASVSTVNLNLNITLGFKEFLVILFSIDIFWIFSHWFMGKIVTRWKRKKILWEWAALNAILITFLILIDFLLDDVYSDFGLLLLFLVNLIAFILDVILIDYFDTI